MSQRTLRWLMLCWMMLIVGMAVVAEPAFAADLPRAAGVYGNAPPVYGRPAYVETQSDLLFTPDERFPHIRFPPPTPLLPGSSALPGYYGSHFSYEYQPYYGGPNLSYWYRLPYACGVYGYC
jgi:hypothetical protein